MDTNRIIDYIHEPTDLQCGQAVLAMITGLAVEDVVQELENDRETTLKEMKDFGYTCPGCEPGRASTDLPAQS